MKSQIPLQTAAFVWILCWIPAILMVLHGLAIVPLGWERLSLNQAQHVAGFSYAIPLATNWMDQEFLGQSPAQVFENGRRLSFANSPTGDIVEKGMGRYSLWAGWLYFSSTDNSDPNANRRQYELYWPRRPNGLLLWGSFLLAALTTVVLAFCCRAGLGKIISQPPFSLSAAI